MGMDDCDSYFETVPHLVIFWPVKFLNRGMVIFEDTYVASRLKFLVAGCQLMM